MRIFCEISCLSVIYFFILSVEEEISFRKHELFPKSSYHGNCPEVTTTWQESDSGVAANIRVKRPAPKAASGKNWELDLLWDAPVSKFEVVSNGVAEQKSGQAFKVRVIGG